MLEIILGIIVGISIVLFVFVIINNNYQLVVIKIDKADEDIDMYLMKKQELLNRARPIIKKELKLDEFLEELDNEFEEQKNLENHNKLKSAYNELFKILDENEKLMKSESLLSILEQLNTNEENIVGAIKFYNDTVVEFNRLVVSFPSNILAFFKRYTKLEFYNNEKREIFEILNGR
ncbi:MAG: LemA family protein [Bacilli bacterium]|nr:LemA family protein [Bacilli bacterium]